MIKWEQQVVFLVFTLLRWRAKDFQHRVTKPMTSSLPKISKSCPSSLFFKVGLHNTWKRKESQADGIVIARSDDEETWDTLVISSDFIRTIGQSQVRTPYSSFSQNPNVNRSLNFEYNIFQNPFFQIFQSPTTKQRCAFHRPFLPLLLLSKALISVFCHWIIIVTNVRLEKAVQYQGEGEKWGNEFERAARLVSCSV